MRDSFLTGTKEVVHDLIRLSENPTKEQSICALYKSIEKAHRLFQVEIQSLLLNKKKVNWSNINLKYFDEIEELMRQREICASCASR